MEINADNTDNSKRGPWRPLTYLKIIPKTPKKYQHAKPLRLHNIAIFESEESNNL